MPPRRKQPTYIPLPRRRENRFRGGHVTAGAGDSAATADIDNAISDAIRDFTRGKPAVKFSLGLRVEDQVIGHQFIIAAPGEDDEEKIPMVAEHSEVFDGPYGAEMRRAVKNIAEYLDWDISQVAKARDIQPEMHALCRRSATMDKKRTGDTGECSGYAARLGNIYPGWQD